MPQNDAWFLGLLALAYRYLDSTPAPRVMNENEFIPGPVSTGDTSLEASRLLPVRIVRSESCPRNELHAVAVRPDGAMWCRACDEAFYPLVLVLKSLTPGVAA